MDFRYLLVLLFLFASCMPSETTKRSNLSSTRIGNTTGTTTSGSGTGNAPTDTTWNYLSVTSKSISLNSSNLTNSYILGLPVEGFLGVTSGGVLTNFTNISYCAVIDYNIGGHPVQLRSVVVPISYFDFTLQRTVRVLRVDFNDVTNSTTQCNKPLMSLNPSGVLQSEAAPISSPINSVGVSFDINTVCSTCASTFTSNKIRLFKVQNFQLEQVKTNIIDVSGLTATIDPNNNSGINNPSCSNSSCVASGYSCCLENQCVREGTIRSSAYTLYPTELQIAEQQRLTTPLIYKNYPQLYFVCGSSIPTNPTTTGSSTTGGTTTNPFAQINADYACIQEIKTKTTAVPFNTEFLNTSFTYTGASSCNLTDSTSSTYYLTVMRRLYSTCGCNSTNLVSMVNNCPAYDYVKNSNGVVECVAPAVSTTPVTYMNANVSSRAAPHRFFDSAGVEKLITASTTDQEGSTGENFAYLDENKIIYNDTAFSMKSILGNMSRTLDQARPAQTLGVEVDQIYLISTLSGYYNPCPNCGKDSWFANFTAFPTSSYGVGLQATGHTTERDNWSTNNTGGNYEDTIFGRACWVPPTMLPFSHTVATGPNPIQTQRLNRLKTQAALYTNGYQRDWYGFNKGAIIGSFDGVTWFPIGKGRIVRSTSKKLFLAINAPFADLATPTINVVNVQQYDGLTQATQLDYDPAYHQSHALQNEAGNCQMYHQCNVDTDCVSKLGWEYMCADVNGTTTTWPNFDANGNETTIAQTLPIEQILLQKRFTGPSTKRCVYRGMGSICNMDSATSYGTDYNAIKRNSCAPNFYCSPLSASTFNTKISRWATNWADIPVSANHLYGREANILGRPRAYIANDALGTLDSDITRNIRANYPTALSSRIGLCRPGKALPQVATASTMWNPFEQQKLTDTSKRTDYINQIASCNSTLFASARHTSCPVIRNGNYIQYTSDFASMTQSSYSTLATAQNACGLETLNTGTVLTNPASVIQENSPFKNIEGKTLLEQTIVNPTLVRDACLRRPGEVCQTDLDCSPNKLHAGEVDLSPLSYFGNTAEKTYYAEYLVCGQADAKPYSTEPEFKTYDMTKNRCCREVGKDLTVYTPDSPLSALTGAAGDIPESRALNMSHVPGTGPVDARRYSRFTNVENLGTTTGTAPRPLLTANDDRNISGQLTAVANILDSASDQWKTLSETNSETCCGGGWIRKFSDGTNDWTKVDRVSMDVQNFQCLNYYTPLVSSNIDDVVSTATNYYPTSGLTGVTNAYQRESNKFCLDPNLGDSGCAQITFSSGTTAVGPKTETTLFSSHADSITRVHAGSVTGFDIDTLNPKFSQSIWYFYKPLSADSHSSVIIDDYISTNTTSRKNFNFFVPAYVSDLDTAKWISDAGTNHNVTIVDNDNTTDPYQCTYTPGLPDFTDPKAALSGTCTATDCCWKYTSSDRRMRVVLNSSGSWNGKKLGVNLVVRNPIGLTGFQNSAMKPSKAGNDIFYLKRLGQLELSGIPQIAHEPLFCNNNSNRLVPGIYKPSIKFYTDQVTPTNSFEAVNNSFYKNNALYAKDYTPYYNSGAQTVTFAHYANYKSLAIDPVFSDKDFKCCTPLGKETSTATTCCSGYSVAGSRTGKYRCMLPQGTDISVYFNRFVSNEGRGTDQPGGGLLDADFDAKTGEPLIQNSVNQKLNSLGITYCSSGKVRQGGAFGSFSPESSTSTSKIYGIVDSSNDVASASSAGSTLPVGYDAFAEGYRWNHHLYCQ